MGGCGGEGSVHPIGVVGQVDRKRVEIRISQPAESNSAAAVEGKCNFSPFNPMTCVVNRLQSSELWTQRVALRCDRKKEVGGSPIAAAAPSPDGAV